MANESSRDIAELDNSDSENKENVVGVGELSMMYRNLDVSNPYGVCGGPVTAGERAFLLEQGLALEDSQGELYGEPSTIIEDEDEEFISPQERTFSEGRRRSRRISELNISQVAKNLSFEFDKAADEQVSNKRLDVSDFGIANMLSCSKGGNNSTNIQDSIIDDSITNGNNEMEHLSQVSNKSLDVSDFGIANMLSYSKGDNNSTNIQDSIIDNSITNGSNEMDQLSQVAKNLSFEFVKAADEQVSNKSLDVSDFGIANMLSCTKRDNNSTNIQDSIITNGNNEMEQLSQVAKNLSFEFDKAADEQVSNKSLDVSDFGIANMLSCSKGDNNSTNIQDSIIDDSITNGINNEMEQLSSTLYSRNTRIEDISNNACENMLQVSSSSRAEREDSVKGIDRGFAQSGLEEEERPSSSILVNIDEQSFGKDLTCTTPGSTLNSRNTGIDDIGNSSMDIFHESSSGAEFEDTITRVDKMLAMAEALEEEERHQTQQLNYVAPFVKSQMNSVVSSTPLSVTTGRREKKANSANSSNKSTPVSAGAGKRGQTPRSATSNNKSANKTVLPITPIVRRISAGKETKSPEILLATPANTPIPTKSTATATNSTATKSKSPKVSPFFSTPSLKLRAATATQPVKTPLFTTYLKNQAESAAAQLTTKSAGKVGQVSSLPVRTSMVQPSPAAPRRVTPMKATPLLTTFLKSHMESPAGTPKTPANYKKGSTHISSPVANYIYSTPNPAKVHRVVKTVDNAMEKKTIPAKKGTSGIPVPMSLPQKSSIPKRVLSRASLIVKPQALVSNQDTAGTTTRLIENKLIKPGVLQSIVYQGSDKAREKLAEGKVHGSPKAMAFKLQDGNKPMLQRHLGLLDENTNVTIVQDESICQAFVPDRVKN